MVVGDETVPAVGQRPPALDTPAPPLTKPVSNVALTLIRQPVAQPILQLDSGVLADAILKAHHQLVKPFIHCLLFEALLERPVVGRNGRYMSIADACRHLQDFLAKVLKAGAVVSKRLVDGQLVEGRVLSTLQHDSNKLALGQLLDVRA